MRMSIDESKTTIEVEKNIELDIDVSQFDIEQRQELLNELLECMTDQEIADAIEHNNKMMSAILVEYYYFNNRELANLFYILESDADAKELKKDLKSLIKKYQLEE